MESYEERWRRASALDAARPGGPASVPRNLEGNWEVQRLSGPLPMPFVWKHVRNGRGETYPSPLPVLGIPFRLEQREGYVALVYRFPLSFMVDELRLEEDGSWLGRAHASGVRYAWFRMLPVWTPEGSL
jgi:hypothetical protein